MAKTEIGRGGQGAASVEWGLAEGTSTRRLVGLWGPESGLWEVQTHGELPRELRVSGFVSSCRGFVCCFVLRE